MSNRVSAESDRARRSSRRRLVTRASIRRPAMSNVSVSPTSAVNQRAESSSSETSGTVEGVPSQKTPATTISDGSSVDAVGHPASAGGAAPRELGRHVARGRPRPPDAGQPRPDHRNEPHVVRRGGQHGRGGGVLVRLDVDGEHVGGHRLEVEAVDRFHVDLLLTDGNEEQRADPDGEQHGLGLIAGTAQIADGIPDGEGGKPAGAPEDGDEYAPGDVEDDGGGGEGGDEQPGARKRPCLPDRDGQDDADQEDARGDLQPVDPASTGVASKEQHRLDVADLEQRRQCEQDRHQQCDSRPFE